MIAPVVIESWPEARTPADLFLQLPRQPGRFLLESQGGPAETSRWSFLGHRPYLRLRTFGRRIQLWDRGHLTEWEDDPLTVLQSLLDRYPIDSLPARRPPAPLPPFPGGAVGYLSYDLGRQIEHLPDTARDDLHLPELCLNFYDHLVAFDHLNQTATLIALPLPDHEEAALTAATQLRQSTYNTSSQPAASISASQLTSNFTRSAYRQAIERTLDYIARGHIYQANIAQRFTASLGSVSPGEPVEPLTPEALYLTLRANNPAPFAAFLDYGDFQIISASPERFLLFDPSTRRVETRPIKGTRPRGQTPAEDELLKAELLASEKDKAELVMIVDLERNDLGRVCDYGSVRVTDLRRIEPYPTVWHTVATVEGKLRANASLTDLIRATFPGGSITGAPKIRAMQIIEELEALRRHVYCGAIGYFGFDGGLDLNIAIRTITIKKDQAYFQAGGGIVADSDPEAEYDETLHKARALARALGVELDHASLARNG